MVRNYKPATGSSRLFKYSSEQMEKAIHEAKAGRLSINKVAEKYDVPRATLSAKVRNDKAEKHGHPCALTEDEENAIVQGLILSSSWGFPLTNNDVCDIVQAYLCKIGKKVVPFKNNKPSRDWISSFLSRHKELSTRFSENEVELQ